MYRRDPDSSAHDEGGLVVFQVTNPTTKESVGLPFEKHPYDVHSFVMRFPLNGNDGATCMDMIQESVAGMEWEGDRRLRCRKGLCIGEHLVVILHADEIEIQIAANLAIGSGQPGVATLQKAFEIRTHLALLE